MSASYGIITGVDNTVTAVVARRRIFIIFSERVDCLKMCETTGGVTESRSRQSGPAEQFCSAAPRWRGRRIKIVRLLGDQRLRSEN
jgi:hypothetical protein